jgi:hypothetical protein
MSILYENGIYRRTPGANGEFAGKIKGLVKPRGKLST